MISPKFKTCNSCKRDKPVADFYHRTGGDGYQYRCKQCQKLARNANRATAGAHSSGRGDDGTFRQPAHVECLICGQPAACSLDNAYWLNQYSDEMVNTYGALCSPFCFKRLIGIVIRMKRLLLLQMETAA